MDQPTTTPRRWRRFLQMRLRTLLVLTAAAGALLGWIAKERRQSTWEQRLAEEVVGAEMGGPFDLPVPPGSNLPQSWWRSLARLVLGERIVDVYLDNDSLDGQTLGKLAGLSSLRALTVNGAALTDLTPLARLTNLRALALYFTSEHDLAPLSGLVNLDVLVVSSSNVTDLAPLRNLTQLRYLTVECRNVADLSPLAGMTRLERRDISWVRAADLGPLAGMSQLRNLYLRDGGVSSEEVDRLYTSLNDCTIEFDATWKD